MKPSTTRPADGTCRHRNAAKLYDCDQPVGKPGWTWCAAHVKAHAEAKRAAAKRPAPKAASKKAATAKRTTPARGTTMEKELAAVAAMKDEAEK